MARKPSGLRIRALVLAAGLGQRLRPLTASVPKPLLPVAGRPVIVHTLARLGALGCEAVAINLHHLGGAVRGALGDDYQGMEITYSEESELLGTLGAFIPLRDFFRPADLVILVNADSLCRWPFAALVRRHQKSLAVATLLVSQRAAPDRYGGGVGVDTEGRIVDFRPPSFTPSTDVDRRVFAGAHVFSPELLQRLGSEPAKSDIVLDLYEPLLAERAQISALATKARWHDLGTPRRYLEGTLDWARGYGPERLWQRRVIAKSATVESGAKVRRSVIEAGARVERGAVVEECVVLAGAKVGAGSRLRSTIVAPDVELPAESSIETRMVTSLRSGRDPGASDSVVGRLVYTPLDRKL